MTTAAPTHPRAASTILPEQQERAGERAPPRCGHQPVWPLEAPGHPPEEGCLGRGGAMADVVVLVVAVVVVVVVVAYLGLKLLPKHHLALHMMARS